MTSAQPGSRSPKQLWLHRASIIILVPTLVSAFFTDSSLLLPTFAILAVQVGAMLLLRFVGVSYKMRLWLLPVIAAASLAIGIFVAIWPVSLLALTLITIAVLLSHVLSVYSFPHGYGERVQ